MCTLPVKVPRPPSAESIEDDPRADLVDVAVKALSLIHISEPTRPY